MDHATGTEQPPVTPPLPASVWVLAWASLADPALALLARGLRASNEISIGVSVGLGGLLFGYVAAGVVRARPVRLVIAWLVLALGGLGQLLALLSVDDADEVVLRVLSLAASAVALAALWLFTRSAWFAWQRTRPPASLGASISRLVMIAVLVGAMSGVVQPRDAAARIQLSVASR